MDWLNGPIDPQTPILFIEAFWVGRFGKILQLISGFVILIDLLGEVRINDGVDKLKKDLDAVKFRQLWENTSKQLIGLAQTVKNWVLKPFRRHPGVPSLPVIGIGCLIFAYLFYVHVFRFDWPGVLNGIVSGIAGLIAFVVFLIISVYLVAVASSIIALLGYLIGAGVAKLALLILRQARFSRLALVVSLTFLIIGFLLDLLVS
jgi:hypothetical protein